MFGLPNAFEDAQHRIKADHEARRRGVRQAADAKMAALRRGKAQMRQTAGNAAQGVAHAGQQAQADYGLALQRQTEDRRLAARAIAAAVPLVADVVRGAGAARHAVAAAGNRAGQAGRDIVLGPAAPNTGGQGNQTGYYQLGAQYLTGLGPRRQVFSQDDPATLLLRRDANLGRLRAAIASGAHRDGRELKWDNEAGGRDTLRKDFTDYAAVPTLGKVGNLADAYLGSYDTKFKVTGVDPNGVATVDMHVSNNSDLKSLSHYPVVGKFRWWKEHVEPHIIAQGPKAGPLSPTRQDFYWRETIPSRSAPAARGGGATGPVGRLRP